MHIKEIGLFYSKKVEGYNDNLPIFSSRFKSLTVNGSFRGAPVPTHPHVEPKTAEWKNLRLGTILNKSKQQIETLVGFAMSELSFFNLTNSCRAVKRKIDLQKTKKPFVITKNSIQKR